MVADRAGTALFGTVENKRLRRYSLLDSSLQVPSMPKKIGLVSQHLERINVRVLEEYQHIIHDYLRQREGVYALYRRGTLYYVGLASDLKWRLGAHLKDRHKAKWDSFSVYLTVDAEHLKELESLMCG
jgi:hypothetical protein